MFNSPRPLPLPAVVVCLICFRHFADISLQIFTYPVEMYVARHVLDVAIFQTLLGQGPRTSHRHFWITVLIWSGTMILALATRNLGSILEIFGAFAGSVSVAGDITDYAACACGCSVRAVAGVESSATTVLLRMVYPWVPNYSLVGGPSFVGLDKDVVSNCCCYPLPRDCVQRSHVARFFTRKTIPCLVCGGIAA